METERWHDALSVDARVETTLSTARTIWAVSDMSIHMTQYDTYCLLADSMHFGRIWFDYGAEFTERADSGDVTYWSQFIREYDHDKNTPMGEWVKVDHETVLRVMQEIADGKHVVMDEYRETVRAIVDAPDNESATDEQCQLDADSDDCIMQIAVIGKITYG